MIDTINLPLILGAAFIATVSPGPATMAIAGTSLALGRKHGLAIASGVTTGSLTWSVGAAAGLSALMFANAWLFEAMRYAGAAYLMWLAFKSARAALALATVKTPRVAAQSLRNAYTKGLALHLTNPKAVLFFGALYSIGIPAGADPGALVVVICAVGLQSFLLFHGYALLFTVAPVVRGYARLRRWFEVAFALAFGAASLKILTAKLAG
ncbi:MAG: LysE family translocator [Alphaproteobacteria bacterium]